MLILLVIIYRSPIFWAIPFFSVLLAEVASRGFGYLLAEAGVTINGQSGGILPVLVFGAGTDYALLLVSRYREELRRHEDKHEAMRIALMSAGPAILASGLTVIAALLTLSIAEVNGTAGLGPVGAMGVGLAMISMLTILPALLVICGRRAFWSPFLDTIPHYGQEGVDETSGFWRRVGDRVATPAARRLDQRLGRAGAARAQPHQPRHRADERQLVPRRGRLRRGPGDAGAQLPGGRVRADRGDRARPYEGAGGRGRTRAAARPGGAGRPARRGPARRQALASR